MAYVVQKIMGKRLGHYWRKVVWILLTIKMCFPFWSVTEKFRQHFFIISMPAYYMGEQNQKTAIMTKIGNVSIREWMSGEKFLPYIWLAGMILCLLFHAIQYRIWKKRIFAECKRMQKNSVLEALKKASEVCSKKKTSNIRHCFSFWNNYFEFFGNANSATNMVIIAYRKLSQMQSCGTRRSGLECMGK